MQRDLRNRNKVARPVALLLALLGACGGQTGSDRDDASGDSDGRGGGVGIVLVTAAAVAIASDSTGAKLVMVGAGIWTSTNGGISWTERAPSGLAHIQKWTSVASDSMGMNLVAVVNGFHDRPGEDAAAYSGDVWTSSDGGATWTDQTVSGPAHEQAWRSVASDASGTKLVAVTAGLGVLGPGAIWTSTDAGVTWTNRTAAETGMGKQSWSSVASDATGMYIVAVGSGSGVWASIDGGTTWTDRTPADPKFQASFGNQMQGWSSVASDGTKLVATVNTGDIWTSTNRGVTWSDAGPATSWQVWVSVASDSTGTNLVAVDGLVNGSNGDIWTSTNGGLTWTDRTPGNPAASGPWTAVASNAAGDRLVVIGRGAIWRN